MEFDDICLNRLETKTLKCLKHHKANIWELHGYLNFPGIEPALCSVQTLENASFIRKEEEQELGSYVITPSGKKYLAYMSKKKRMDIWKSLGSVILTLAGLVAIVEFVLPALSNLLR